MSALEAFPGRLSETAHDVSDDLLRPEDRFTPAERARPRLSWLDQSAAWDPGAAAAPQGAFRRRAAVGQGRALTAHGPRLARPARAVSTLQDITVGLVSRYVSNNVLPPVALPALIVEVHTALSGLSAAAGEAGEGPRKPTPAEIRRSIRPDALISFIDGKPYKTLKRHLGTHGLDMEGYRRRYGLPADYPTVAASYSATRSALAKASGLGRTPAPEAAAEPLPAERKPGRRGRRTGAAA